MSMQDRRSNTPVAGGSEPALPKRFYQVVSVAPASGGFALLLDGRPARTPARHSLVLPTAAAAQAVADEWAAVTGVIDPRRMPMTRLVNSVIDGVTRTRDAVLAEVIRYAGSDLLVYRADAPPDLVLAQKTAWDPVLAWSRDTIGAALTIVEGVMFVPQPAASINGLEKKAEALVGEGAAAPFRLGALSVMTTLTGSALLGLAVLAGRLTAGEAWAAAHVDEDFQISQWGADDEATERRARRWTDMETAARFCVLTRPDEIERA